MKPIKPKGFTLLEVLIAIFIFSLVLSILYTSYRGTFRNIEDTESKADIYQMARVALERMVEDLESIYISQWGGPSESEESTNQQTGFLGVDTEINGRDADTLHFISRGHVLFNEEDEDTGTAAVAYYVRENDQGDYFTLYRSDTPEFKERPEQGTGGFILCDDLHSVNFTYHDDKGMVHDSWDSTKDEYKGRLPSMVTIVLEFLNRSDPESPLKFMTGVALPMVREKVTSQ